MSLVIDDEVLKASGLTEAELRLEMAVHLFEIERLTMSRAARLAAMPLAARAAGPIDLALDLNKQVGADTSVGHCAIR